MKTESSSRFPTENFICYYCDRTSRRFTVSTREACNYCIDILSIIDGYLDNPKIRDRIKQTIQELENEETV